SLRSTAVLSASSDWSRWPALRYRMPRFTYGADSCGNCSATCLNSSSASVALPAFMKPTARSKSALPRAVTGCAEPPGVEAEVEAPEAPLELAAPAFAASAAAGCEADSVGFVGAELHAANSIALANASATSTCRPSPALSVEARDHILRQL